MRSTNGRGGGVGLWPTHRRVTRRIGAENENSFPSCTDYVTYLLRMQRGNGTAAAVWGSIDRTFLTYFCVGGHDAVASCAHRRHAFIYIRMYASCTNNKRRRRRRRFCVSRALFAMFSPTRVGRHMGTTKKIGFKENTKKKNERFYFYARKQKTATTAAVKQITIIFYTTTSSVW